MDAEAEPPGPDAEEEGPDADGPDAEGPDTEGPDAEGPDADGPETPELEAEGPETDGPETDGVLTEGPDTEGARTEGVDAVAEQPARIPEITSDAANLNFTLGLLFELVGYAPARRRASMTGRRTIARTTLAVALGDALRRRWRPGKVDSAS